MYPTRTTTPDQPYDGCHDDEPRRTPAFERPCTTAFGCTCPDDEDGNSRPFYACECGAAVAQERMEG